MNNVEIVTELLRRVPLMDRIAVYENLRGQFGLTEDEMMLAFWRAEGRTDAEIDQIKAELKSESEVKALMNFISEIGTRNPSGNLPLGDPNSNLVKVARLAQITKQGTKIREAFIEVFGRELYEELIKSA